MKYKHQKILYRYDKQKMVHGKYKTRLVIGCHVIMKQMHKGYNYVLYFWVVADYGRINRDIVVRI